MADKIGGIYAIEDARGFLYYGSAVNFKRRWYEHRRALNAGNHKNKKLQNAWNKYGPAFFTFYPVETIKDKTKLIEHEQRWINLLISTEEWYYNVCHTAGSTLGRKRAITEKTRKGSKLSEEAKDRISKANKGRRTWLGRKHTEESKRKNALAKLGKTQSAETRVKRAIAMSGGKKYSFIDSAGNVYSDILNLTEFAKLHNLDQSNLRRVAIGEYKQHKGFRLFSIDMLDTEL